MNDKSPFEQTNQSKKGIIIAALVCLAVITVGIILSVNAYNDKVAENNARVISESKKEEPYPSSIPNTTYEIKPFNSEGYKEQANAGKTLTQSYYASAYSSAQISESAAEVMGNYTEEISFINPVMGEVLNSYSDEVLVFSNTLGDWRTHPATDYKGKVGDPVSAVANGTVKSFVYDELYGNVLTLSHSDGYESVYCGLNDIVFFTEGDKVNQGDVLGTLSGNIPIETAEECHLHLEITKNGEYINPTELIK